MTNLVVFMGDSITHGWAEQPFIKSRPQFVGRGIGGQTTAQMLARFEADVIALKPAVVHIMGGTNDVAENMGPQTDEQIEGNIEKMADLALAKGIRVILASIPPAADIPWHPGLNPNPRIQRLNAWIREYAARSGAIYVDYWATLATPDGAMKREFSPDGVHPNALGFAAMEPPASSAIEQALIR